MSNVLIAMEQIKYMIMMMERDLQTIVNYVIKKDILILRLLIVHIVIILVEYGLLKIKEVFQMIAKIVMEKVIFQERN